MTDQFLFAGYALQFNTDYTATDGSRLRVKNSALRFTPVVTLCAGHDRDRVFGSTADGSLAVACDSFGVRVSFTPVNSRSGFSLAAAIARRDYYGLSCGTVIEASHIENGVEVVTAAEIPEVSVVSDPRCPGCACWPADADPADLPDDLRALAMLWAAGASQPAPLSRPLASARPPAALLNKIDTILQSARTCIPRTGRSGRP